MHSLETLDTHPSRPLQEPLPETLDIMARRLGPVGRLLLRGLGAGIHEHTLVDGRAPGLLRLSLPPSPDTLLWFQPEEQEQLGDALMVEAQRPGACDWIRRMARAYRDGRLFGHDGSLDLEDVDLTPERMVRELLRRP